ncbi:MAG: VOC family protein [Sedimentisphaerales bacterium]|nr:VOC family protein [Sedimentisphaerales bacterium]
MQIPGLGHVGLSVSDMQRSLAFYRDIMGMEVVLQLDIVDDRQARVIGVPGTKCRIAHLRLGDGVLELFEYYQPRGQNKAQTMQQRDHGIVHIGFEIDDFHERVELLKRNGVKFVGEPVEFRPGVWVLYFYGPDGEVCELHDVSKFKKT